MCNYNTPFNLATFLSVICLFSFSKPAYCHTGSDMDLPSLLQVHSTLCDSTFHPLAYEDHLQAMNNTVCDLNDLASGCYTMPDVNLIFQRFYLCNIKLDNVSFFSFTAGDGEYTINIDAQQCTPGTDGDEGIQVGVFNTESFNINQTIFDLDPVFCTDTSGAYSLTITSDLLVPGNRYILLLAGWRGAVCDYTFNIEGNYLPHQLTPPATVDCKGRSCDSLCANGTATFEVLDTFNLTYERHLYKHSIWNRYYWSLRNEDGDVLQNYQSSPQTFITNTNKVEVPPLDKGSYMICIDSVVNVCSNTYVDLTICHDIIVDDFTYEDEDFGVVEVCNDEIILYQGPLFDAFGNSDPNGDGYHGWQDEMFFFTGFQYNIAHVTNPNGCQYKQQVFIKPKYNQFGIVDTIVCDEEDFPFYIADFLVEFPIENLLYTAFDQASNGCDSIINITVLLYNLRGKFENKGCDAEGNFKVKFYEIDSLLSYIILEENYPILSYEWTDADGNLLEYDASDPSIISVPDYGMYNLDITMFKGGREATGVCKAHFNTEISPEDGLLGNEEFGTILICPDSISQGVGILSDLDPNGDGILGWLGQRALTYGQNIDTIFSGGACYYTQRILIDTLPNDSCQVMTNTYHTSSVFTQAPTIMTSNSPSTLLVVCEGECTEDIEIWIFNSYGHMLYHSTNYRNGWDAQGQPSGIYYYVAKSGDAMVRQPLVIVR